MGGCMKLLSVFVLIFSLNSFAAPVLFKEVFENVLKENCITCHNGKPSKSAKKYDLRTYGKIMGVKDLVVAGKPEDSNLYLAVKKDDMPMDNDPLTKEQKDLIYQWILDGAKES
jgi:uncharacterized membrane protein